jgi:methylenetetrahydrofolate reductase (NADPH)
MMPIQSYSSFEKMTSYCKTKVPPQIWESLEPIKGDDEEVKRYGVALCIDMCKKLQAADLNYFHFYTLNLEKSVFSILRSLGAEQTTACRRALPWRGSRSNLNGQSEDVRPINWANRTKSYIQRTETWDEYPNGRWGDGRSPAFGELSNYHFFKPMGTKDERLAMWGEAPIEYSDIYEIFARYVEGKIPVLPWCESSLQSETLSISSPLADINRKGFLTINSQPAVNGEKSDHQVYGWGGPGGRVYQKAYVEFFASPDLLNLLVKVVNTKPNLSLHAVNHDKDVITNTSQKGVTAVTWGVFPNREIIQPTVFDHDVFLIWSEEAFRLWLSSWASLYDDETESCEILYQVNKVVMFLSL